MDYGSLQGRPLSGSRGELPMQIMIKMDCHET